MLNLKVCELRILLPQNVCHVVNQMKTKSVLGGDFLTNTECKFYIIHMKPSATRLMILFMFTFTFSVESLMQVE